MGTLSPESKSQPSSKRDEDPHESVTIAPPPAIFEDLLERATPVLSPSSRGDEHFREALYAGARAGLSLTELSQMIAELSGGVAGARLANEGLARELATLRAMLRAQSERQQALRERIAALEEELTTSLAEAKRERDFLIEEQDRFLSGLLEDHERALQTARREALATEVTDSELSALARRLAEAESGRRELEAERERASETRLSLTAQRDEAQARAEKRERERDELRAEASRLRAQLGSARTISTTPPPPGVARPPSFRPAAALELDAGELDVTLRSRPPSARTSTQPGVGTPLPPSVPHSPAVPPLPASAPRSSPVSFGPPPAGQAPRSPQLSPRPASVSAASLPPPRPSDTPPLKQKPDPLTRPLIGYSLGVDGVRSETLEDARFPSKPPQKR